jgi:anthranilate synthase component 1
MGVTLKAPFDISGDLDTPVSAFMKLAQFRPHFLLESVEGGERLARYSFIGFGDCLEVKLHRDGLDIGARTHPVPQSAAELLAALRIALSQVPQPLPQIAGVPLAGGLVGYAAYDVVRFFERLPGRSTGADGIPALHYVAPRSPSITSRAASRCCTRAQKASARVSERSSCALCAAVCRVRRFTQAAMRRRSRP